ncbi:hypothetical protein C2845_PM09G07570 [Panicum miliaceum]|uniref:Uncharacterized protein n=1 Tax=Panicum miliaceum TaxID=4540 RepID=A0A3L6RZZ7_PANMI|nr:hypothetical protein C2845_PM09G07570 [Panicum miliaceum]
MTRSKVAVPLLLLLVVLLSGSWACRPAAAARPLLADDGHWVEQTAPASADSVIVLPSAVGTLWHKLPPLEMKPAGPSCKGSTWDPNNGCPTPPTTP